MIEFNTEIVKECLEQMYIFSGKKLIVYPDKIPLSSEYFSIQSLLNVLKSFSMFRIKVNEECYKFFAKEEKKQIYGLLFKERQCCNEIPDYVYVLHREFVNLLGELVYFLNYKYMGVFKDIDSLFTINFAKGLAEYENMFRVKCLESHMNADGNLINLSLLGYEANGNMILYNQEGTIYKFVIDDNGDNLIAIPSAPNGTFFQYVDMNDVESLIVKLKDYIITGFA